MTKVYGCGDIAKNMLSIYAQKHETCTWGLGLFTKIKSCFKNHRSIYANILKCG